MAMSRRGKRFGRRFGRRNRANLDWVTGQQGYNFGQGPVVIPDGSQDVLRLSRHRGVEGNVESEFFEPQHTVIRVKGRIWCWILPTSNWWETLTGRQHFTFRITKGIQVQDTAQPIYNYLDITTPSGGQDEFMWQQTEYFVAQSAWGDLEVDPTLYVRVIDVDITVKRKLAPDESLILVAQYGPGRGYSSELVGFPDGAYDCMIRVLLEQK